MRKVFCLCVIGILLPVLSLAQATPVTTTDNFTLSFSRHYGRSVFSQCRLDLVVYEKTGVASLWCDSTVWDRQGRRVPDLNARLELTSDETKRLVDTVRDARLYDGGHIGTDSTAVDGTFETLKFRRDNQAVVLVVSGNPTFNSDDPRKQLLSMLNGFEKRLREKPAKYDDDGQ